MRKKILALAATAAMTFSMMFSALAETKDFTVDAAFSANSGEEQLTGDFDVTYKFHCNGYKADGETWETFAVELTTAGVGSTVGGTDASYLTAVVGNQNQWWFNDSGVENAWAGDFTSSYTDADKSLAVLADADVECNVVRSGEKLTISAVCTGTAGTAEYTLETTNTAGFGDTINIHITGEDCEVSNITFTQNSGSSEEVTSAEDGDSTEETTVAEEDDTTVSDETTTAAEKTTTKAAVTTTAASEESDGVSPVVIVVIIVVVVVVVVGIVVATRKKEN